MTSGWTGETAGDLTDEPTGELTGLVPRVARTGSVPVVEPAPARRRAGRSTKGLRVDWPACKAHGLCHELLPELIELDEWGYPVVPAGGVRLSQLDAARRAVAACPTLALRLVDSRPG